MNEDDRKKAEKEIRKLAKEGKVVMCESEVADQYAEEIDELLLKVFGIKSAFVSDESRCSHFCDDAWAIRATELFGIPLQANDALVIDVAAAIREAR